MRRRAAIPVGARGRAARARGSTALPRPLRCLPSGQSQCPRSNVPREAARRVRRLGDVGHEVAVQSRRSAQRIRTSSPRPRTRASISSTRCSCRRCTRSRSSSWTASPPTWSCLSCFAIGAAGLAGDLGASARTGPRRHPPPVRRRAGDRARVLWPARHRLRRRPARGLRRSRRRRVGTVAARRPPLVARPRDAVPRERGADEERGSALRCRHVRRAASRRPRKAASRGALRALVAGLVYAPWRAYLAINDLTPSALRPAVVLQPPVGHTSPRSRTARRRDGLFSRATDTQQFTLLVALGRRSDRRGSGVGPRRLGVFAAGFAGFSFAGLTWIYVLTPNDVVELPLHERREGDRVASSSGWWPSHRSSSRKRRGELAEPTGSYDSARR